MNKQPLVLLCTRHFRGKLQRVLRGLIVFPQKDDYIMKFSCVSKVLWESLSLILLSFQLHFQQLPLCPCSFWFLRSLFLLHIYYLPSIFFSSQPSHIALLPGKHQLPRRLSPTLPQPRGCFFCTCPHSIPWHSDTHAQDLRIKGCVQMSPHPSRGLRTGKELSWMGEEPGDSASRSLSFLYLGSCLHGQVSSPVS